MRAAYAIDDQSIGSQCFQSELPSWKHGAPFSTISEFRRMFGFSPVLLSRTGFRTKFFHRVGLLLLFASK
jgi:hypothetical protein